MQDKVLYIEYEKCTGCRECEVACSVYNTGASDPSLSRIKVINWEWEATSLPMTCQNCEDPFCVEVCPARACHYDAENCRVVIDPKKCIGCKTCIIACPFNAPFLDHARGVSVKCEYCDGDPQCVRACRYDAIHFVDASDIGYIRQQATARKYMSMIPKEFEMVDIFRYPLPGKR
jgi:Fe-S-cluster-containing dehydrogenase component